MRLEELSKKIEKEFQEGVISTLIAPCPLILLPEMKVRNIIQIDVSRILIAQAMLLRVTIKASLQRQNVSLGRIGRTINLYTNI
jgi:hypothetical protein